MTKQEQFLYVVQTTILANAINITTMEKDRHNKFRHIISATGICGLMGDALWTSDRIPESLNAVDAAAQFCGFMLDNLREIEERAREARREVPAWFAR